MPEVIITTIAASQPWQWGNRILWSIVAMFVLGSMARTFISNEPFDPKKFAGEVIFAAIGAILIYSAGLMQGMTEIQIVSFGALASLGGVRVIEWILKIANKANKVGLLDE